MHPFFIAGTAPNAPEDADMLEGSDVFPEALADSELLQAVANEMTPVLAQLCLVQAVLFPDLVCCYRFGNEYESRRKDGSP